MNVVNSEDPDRTQYMYNMVIDKDFLTKAGLIY